MSIEIESFPHGGEHCNNDLRQSHVTMLMLAIFALFATAVIVVGLSVLGGN